MILNLAQFQGILDRIKITRTKLGELLFCDNPSHFIALAMVDEKAVGFVMYNVNYSNICFNETPGLYIENLFIQSEYRHRGIGKGLLTYVATQAKEKNYTRVEWWVSHQNQPAINFYKSIGGKALDEWLIFKCEEACMNELVGESNEIN